MPIACVLAACGNHSSASVGGGEKHSTTWSDDRQVGFTIIKNGAPGYAFWILDFDIDLNFDYLVGAGYDKLNVVVEYDLCVDGGEGASNNLTLRCLDKDYDETGLSWAATYTNSDYVNYKKVGTVAIDKFSDGVLRLNFAAMGNTPSAGANIKNISVKISASKA